MSRIALNKTVLHARMSSLATYERFLPSLDLKRRTLLVERERAFRDLQRTRERIEQERAWVSEELPMLANTPHLDALDGVGRVARVELGEQNLLGTKLPVLRELTIERSRLDPFSTPHWFDDLSLRLSASVELEIRAASEAERARTLEQAVLKATQRVNLFERVLIPRTRREIARIKIALADAERTAVVRSKLVKQRHQRDQECLR